MWACGHAGMWACGHVGMWGYAQVGMSGCGHVEMCGCGLVRVIIIFLYFHFGEYNKNHGYAGYIKTENKTKTYTRCKMDIISRNISFH